MKDRLRCCANVHVSIGLRLNDAGRFVRNPNGYLRNPPAALDSLAKSVAHDLALIRDEVPHRAAARKAVHRFKVFCNPLPHRVEPLARNLLSTLG